MSVARLEHVSKSYRLGVDRSNWRALVPGRWGDRAHGHTFDAVRDVSLEIEEGAALGLIGANGAGKSTILKILAGLVEPTAGRVEVNGRVAPIIELGVGFNPDLTGAENVRFGGALLGMADREIERHYSDIVEFAGLEEFIDTPLKRYSTGMRARLGFALVTSFESDLLLLDEVLSVGDWEFQRRSLDRIRALHTSGAAVVAVSHSNWLISQLCDELALIEGGSIAAIGDPVRVIGRYVGEEVIGIGEPVEDDRPVADLVGEPPADSPVRIDDLEVVPAEVEPGDALQFRCRVTVDAPVDARLVMSIYSIGRAAFAEPDEGPSDDVFQVVAVHEVSARIPVFPVAPGNYHLRVAAIAGHREDDYDQLYLEALAKQTVGFRVVGPATSRPGLCFRTEWESRVVNEYEVQRDGP